MNAHGITHRGQCLYTDHPALLVDFCGNCGARLWGADECQECHHKREKPRRGSTEASGNGSRKEPQQQAS